MADSVSGTPIFRAGLIFVLCFGCMGSKTLTKDYGGSTGTSLNGTGVFYDLLQGLGHQMARTGQFTPTLMERADVIVFFQRSPEGIPREVESWFQTWLSMREGRVVLFVGREFDASVHFWDDVLHPSEATATDAQLSPLAQVQYNESLARLQELGSVSIAPHHSRYPFAGENELSSPVVNAEADKTATLAPSPTKGAHLYLRHHANPEPPGKTEGASQPATGDPPKSPARFRTDTIESSDAPGEVLLRVRGAPMVMSKQVGRGKAIIVANGSFLLNYSLINHEHRMLALNLAEQLGARRNVWFVEDSRIASAAGMAGLKFPNPLAFLFVSPINWVVIHWLLVGAAYLLYKSPIFGRPQSPVESQLHRFSSHLKAYGKLLQQTRDKDYALTLIENYRANVKRGG